MLNYLTLGLFQNPLCLPSQLLLLPRPVSTPFCLMQHFLHSALATFFGVPMVKSYMQKAGDSWDISPQIFLDFPQNFRLRTRNQYCTQAIA